MNATNSAIWLTNTVDFLDFLEKEIAAGRNPTNPDEWHEFFRRFREHTKDKVLCLGSTKSAVNFLSNMGRTSIQ